MQMGAHSGATKDMTSSPARNYLEEGLMTLLWPTVRVLNRK